MTDDEQRDAMIPISTIARIFKEVSFKDEKTRITQNTLHLSTEYIKLFINEAIIRSNEERIVEGNTLNTVDGIDNVVPDIEPTFDNGPSEVTMIEQDDNMDSDEDPDDMGDGATQKQLAFRADVNLDNNTLDSRHLAKVAGLLVLDF